MDTSGSTNAPAGHKINYRHYRQVLGPKGKPQLIRFMRNDLHPTPLAQGGKTVCSIHFNGKTFVGEGVCYYTDNFCYEKGRRHALDNAIEAIVDAGCAAEAAAVGLFMPEPVNPF